MNLIDNIKVGLSADQLERMVRIDNENYKLVLQKTRKQLKWQGLPYRDDFLERGLLALKMYYAVAVLDGANPHAVSDIVDPFWHSHIICTEAYDLFCFETAGYFMHHVPHDEESEEQISALKDVYHYTMDIYDEIFYKVDREMNPRILTRDRCICWHFNTEQAENFHLFPPRGELGKLQKLFKVA